MKLFKTISLSKEMLKNLENLKYTTMTPIQEKSIPLILKGCDILAQAKTGSGKTAAFGIGLLEKFNVEIYRVQSLIICPTRELAEQVTTELRRLARFKHNIKILKITGGIPQNRQEQSLNHQAHIIVGTPGRVLKLLKNGSINLNNLKFLVLDEADRMLDMGFIDVMREIIDFAPLKRQTLCFSATFPNEIKALCKTIQNNPVDIKVETEHSKDIIQQKIYFCSPKNKLDLALDILAEYRPESTVIFCNTKDNCRLVAKYLNRSGLHSLALEGDMEQKQRTETLIRFSNGSSRILVATDVAARGLDIPDLSLVLNYDLPFETETYIHRIGRTGRAGKEGLSISLMSEKEQFRLNLINEKFGYNLVAEDWVCKTEQSYESLIPDMITLSINGGRKNKISAGDIVGALTSENGILGNEVGKIDRLDFITFVAVKREVANKAFSVLESSLVKGRKFRAVYHD